MPYFTVDFNTKVDTNAYDVITITYIPSVGVYISNDIRINIDSLTGLCNMLKPSEIHKLWKPLGSLGIAMPDLLEAACQQIRLIINGVNVALQHGALSEQ